VGVTVGVYRLIRWRVTNMLDERCLRCSLFSSASGNPHMRFVGKLITATLIYAIPSVVEPTAVGVTVAAEAELPSQPPACPENLAPQVARKLGYLSTPQYRVCKPMPNAPDKSIVALSVLSGGLSDSDVPDGDMGSYDLDVMIVQSGTGRVLSRLLQESAYESDAYQFTGLDIDTARYNLAPGVRAFGLRAGHSTSSHVSSLSDSKLRLFVEEGNTLRLILKDLVVSQSTGEWDMNCAGQSSETRRTLTVAPTRSHGFADLIVTSATVETKSEMVAGECVEKPRQPPKVSHATLHYDGKVYVVPKELR